MTHPQSSEEWPEARNWHTAVNDAERGSERLYDAMRDQFLRFAARHGVTVHDAMLFCMNAEAPL